MPAPIPRLALLLLLAPLPTEARPVTLPEVLARARALRGGDAAAQVAEARAQVGATSPALAPKLHASYTESQPRKHVSLEESLGNVATYGAERAALRQDVLRARADSLRAALDVERLARLAFFHALAARESLRLARDESTLADSLTAVADARLRQGDIAQLERDQAALEAARVKLEEAPAEAAARSATALLAATMGWNEPDAPEPDGDLADALDQPASPAPPPLRLPELRAALADSAASAARWRAARTARLPWPDLEVGVEWDDQGTGDRPLALVGVVLPLGFGQTAAAAAAAHARAQRDANRAGAMRYEAARAILDAQVRRDAAATRARESRDRILPLATSVRARSVRSYRLGETSLVAALEAMRAEREAAFAFVAELSAFQEARIEWDALAGSAP